MVSEAMHSFADTITEVLLYVAGRSAERPPDVPHPLGHGRRAFLWAFLASCATFVFGAGFSIAHGLQELGSDEPPTNLRLNLAILALSAVLEAVSLRRSRQESRRRARRWRVSEVDFLRATSDTALRALVTEDVVALLGLGVAAAGILLAAVTGSELWDALASIGVGVVLLVVAILLARRNLSLLVGRSAPLFVLRAIAEEIAGADGIVAVTGLVTESTGPGRYVVLARVDLVDSLTGAQVEALSNDIEQAVRRRFPGVDAVYLHAGGA
jgi:cation diffusion facilitator family transporter